jgi:hypothetical protein
MNTQEIVIRTVHGVTQTIRVPEQRTGSPAQDPKAENRMKPSQHQPRHNGC